MVKSAMHLLNNSQQVYMCAIAATLIIRIVMFLKQILNKSFVLWWRGGWLIG